MKFKLKRSLGMAICACMALVGVMSCETPYQPSQEPSDETVQPNTVTDTKFNYQMIFDCQRSNTATTFTASGLKTPMDDAKSGSYSFVTIAELDSTNASYNSTYYITLDITTASDGDTISVAALTLRNASGGSIRTISANGAIKFLGSEGFIYISTKTSAGYFFSSKTHNKGETVTYTYTKATVTKKSELGW